MNVWVDCQSCRRIWCFSLLYVFSASNTSPIIFLHCPQKYFSFFSSDSWFFLWGLECCLFRLMCVTGIGSWNEEWLHANGRTSLAPRFTHCSSKWLMEWLEGRFVWIGKTILCCCQDPRRAAGKHSPIFAPFCSASNIYCLALFILSISPSLTFRSNIFFSSIPFISFNFCCRSPVYRYIW